MKLILFKPISSQYKLRNIASSLGDVISVRKKVIDYVWSQVGQQEFNF